MVSPTENLTMYLILSYSVSDGCSFFCTETVPIVAESPEAAIVEFDEAYNAAMVRLGNNWYPGEFTACGRKFTVTDFYVERQYCSPTIQTFEEWCAANQE